MSCVTGWISGKIDMFINPYNKNSVRTFNKLIKAFEIFYIDTVYCGR